MRAGAGNYIILTVSRALELLELFQEGDAEPGSTDLSRQAITEPIAQPYRHHTGHHTGKF